MNKIISGRAIEQVLPIYKVEFNCIISRQGDVTIVFKLLLPDIFTLSAEEYETLHLTWVKAIKALPAGTVLHKRDTFIKAAYKAKVKPYSSFLSEAGEQFFDGREYIEHSCTIAITKTATERKAASSGYSTLMRKSPVPAAAVNPAMLADFMEKAGAFERILSDSGFIKLQRLTDDQLAGTKDSAGLIERYCFLLGEHERPVIKDVHLQDGVRIGHDDCQLFTLADVNDLPALCGSRVNYEPYSTDKTRFSIGFATPMGLLLDCNHEYNQYLFIGDSQQTLKGLEKKRLRLQSLSAYSRENAIARDATSDFLNEAIGQQRLPIKAHFNLMCWTDKESELQEIRNKVSSAAARLDASVKQETDGAPQIWWAGIPGNAGDFPMNDTFDTFLEQGTCFLNVDGNYSSDARGIRFSERLYGRPVMIDLFDAPMKNGTITNRNVFMCGGSGAGKSVLGNHLLRSLHEQGAHCVTIDVGNSYRGLCEEVMGYYFIYTEDNPIKFNPFYIADGDYLDIEKRESLKTLLVTLWKRDGQPVEPSEYVAISTAINLYYMHLNSHPEVFPCFNTFYEFLMEHYLKVLDDGKVREKDFDAANFLYVLNPYYKGGEFDYLLNATENLDMLNQRFIVFELDNVKSHPILFPVVTIIIMELFISKMRKLKGQRKVIAIDEAWIAIAKSGMSSFIKYLYKTVRKFNGIAALITQEVDDLIASPILKETVVNMSDTKMLLDMRKFTHKFEPLQQVLGLSAKAKILQLSVNRANDPRYRYREVFIDQGGQVMKVYRVEISPSEYLTYTTEESEKLEVQRYAERYGSMEAGIKALLAERQLQTINKK